MQAYYYWKVFRACLVKVRVNLFVGLGYAEDLIVMAFSLVETLRKPRKLPPKTAHIRQFFPWQRSRFIFFASNPITYQTDEMRRANPRAVPCRRVCK
jgi:hypothetical protein